MIGRTAIVLGTTLVAVMAVASDGAAQQPAAGERTIRVSGSGEVRVEPDLATLQFAVETTGGTAQEAGESNAELMDRVIRALVEAGVSREDIQTSGYSLFPVYANASRDQPLETPAIRGYRASNQVSVRSADLEGLGELIDVALGAGANRLNGVFFELRDSAAAEAEALSRAVAAARRSAETMARSLGVGLGPVLDASTGVEPIQPFVTRGMAMEADVRMAVPTRIEPGQQTVRATASIVYAIE